MVNKHDRTCPDVRKRGSPLRTPTTGRVNEVTRGPEAAVGPFGCFPGDWGPLALRHTAMARRD